MKPVHTVPALPLNDRDAKRCGAQDGLVRKRPRAPGWPCRLLLAVLLAVLTGRGWLQTAAARDVAEDPGGPLWGVISELRGGVLAHDVVFPSTRNLNAPNPFHHHFERGVNLNAEVVFVSPRFLHVILSPRPRAGGSVNTLGYTSNAYVDLDWRWQLAVGPFFEGFLGVAVHDGKLRNANPEFAELGTRFLFHIGLEAGFRFFDRHGLSLFWEHMSNSALSNKNQGMDSTGIRYGYRFEK